MMSSKVASIVIYSILVTVVSAQVWCYYGKHNFQLNNEDMFYFRYISTNWQPNHPTGHSSTMPWILLSEVSDYIIIHLLIPTICRNYQKNYNYNNYQTNSYGCANGICSRSGCSEDSHGLGSCCCRGNYCNSGFNLSKTAVSSMVVTIVSVVYMYL
ncbi:Protein CBR-TAG-234 [Caenorhabditis briggsae]|uniref:Protein CBR-TAG-234 n=1 Tax=Caenorhabditis briggsae TaxID=6238 RepID=A8WU38_CAEBR|nr:Protein CBR-TAG-234 [Caenorhabditis briggsae]CAP24000.2 Protein CBR-TAG-234 [Caenorhabditis briggsae]